MPENKNFYSRVDVTLVQTQFIDEVTQMRYVDGYFSVMVFTLK